MAGRPLGRKNIRAFMGSDELQRLGISPLEKSLGCIQELDELIKLNVDAFKSLRGYNERSDSGSQYLANAIRGVQEKNATYLTMAKFQYATLSAVAIKEIGSESSEKAPMTTREALEILKNDPMAPPSLKEISTDRVLDAMNSQINTPSLPFGKDK